MKAIPLTVETRWSLSFPGFSVSERRYPGRLTQPRHAHDTTSVTFIVSGLLGELVGEEQEQAGACSVVVKPAGTEHRNWYGDQGARTLAVELQPEFLAELDADDGLRRWRWSHCGPPARVLIRILDAIRRGNGKDPHELEEDLIELLAVLTEEEVQSPAGEPPAWLVHAVDELRNRRNSAFRIRDTAAAVGFHPVYLARQFRRYFGCSATTYLLRARLKAAAELVSSTDRPFSGVAYDSGFTDQSHFCRAFKSSFGLTPKRYRRLATG